MVRVASIVAVSTLCPVVCHHFSRCDQQIISNALRKFMKIEAYPQVP